MNKIPCDTCIVKIMCKDPCDEFLSHNSKILDDFVEDAHYDHPEAVIYQLSRRIRYNPIGIKTISLFYGQKTIEYIDVCVRDGMIISMNYYR